MFDKDTVFDMIKKKEIGCSNTFTLHTLSINDITSNQQWFSEHTRKLPSSLPADSTAYDRPFNPSQVGVTAVTEATGSCTLKVSPLLQIKDTTTVSTSSKLFIYSKAKLRNFLRTSKEYYGPFDIATDLLKVFLGNASVNTLGSAIVEDASQWTNVIARAR
jgi:hypothetical protein